ncbi:MAG: SDR family NAD(P)-dependent oxidoreductase [Cyclobacteriaceae bacterium]
MDKKQKIVLITGSNGELGKVIVKRFAAEGYHVIGTVRPGKLPESTENSVKYTEVDLLNELSCQQLITNIIKTHGQLDAVINIAGGFAMGNFESTAEEDIDQMIDINFKTAFFISKPAANAMKSLPGEGKIVLISGKPAFTHSKGKNTLAYSISKSMLLQLSALLNEEFKKKGVVTTVVAPGTMDTKSNRDAMPDSDFSQWVQLDNVAKTIAFICADDGKEIRDTVIKLYGNF